MTEEIKPVSEEIRKEVPSQLNAENGQYCDTNYVDKKMRSMLILNIILALAVVLLFVLYLTGKSPLSKKASPAVAFSGSSIKVAYVNNDSILTGYELVKKMRTDLEAKGKRLESELTSKQKAFDKDAAYFQEQVKKKSLSDQSAQEIYAQLTQEQQKINDLRQRYSAELQQNEMQMNVVLLDTVTNFLKRYNSVNKFDYVLGFSKGGNILLANDTLNITQSVLEELNKEYKGKAK
jgi:outer membrane protein